MPSTNNPSRRSGSGSNASDPVTFSPAEFEQLNLDSIIYAPLAATIKAHVQAANTTLDYIEQVNKMGDKTFTRTTKDSTGTDVTKTISVPTLALVKVPNINFDSLSLDFEYSISQVYMSKSSRDFALGGNAGGGIGPIKFGLKGSYSNSKSSSNTINKSGSLSIKVHASESAMPEGLAKVINWLTQSVDEQNDGSTTPTPSS